MAAEWKEIPFSEAVLLNPTTPLKRGGVYPFVDMQAIAPNTRGVRCSEHREFTGGGSRFQNQDTLMARITPCLENGKIARFLAPDGESVGHGSTEFIVVRGRPSVTDNDYAYYLTISPEVRNFAISQMTGSSGRQRVPTDSLGNINVLLPPLAEQKTIAGILSALDDKIELNLRKNETLEALAQSLFKSWFVDATQYALPKGWRYAAIAELCDINAWMLNKGDELDRIEYVEISEVSRGNIASIQVFPRGEEPSRARRRLRHGDTVLSTVRPERGSYFLCLNPPPNLIASTGFAVVTPTKAPWSFIHAALTHPEVSEHLGQQADGGAYPAVHPDIIGKWEVPWPNKPEKVEQFHRACAPLYERAEHNRRESRTLAALRDALLPKLLSGELRVPATKCKLEAGA